MYIGIAIALYLPYKNNQMKKILYTILLACLTLTVTAQESWTIECCMRYAVEHCTTVQKKIFEAANTKSDYHSAVMSFAPKLTACISEQYNWGRNIDPETNTYNTVTTFNNYYEIYTSMYLFDGGQIINQYRQAKVARQQGLNDIQKVRDDKVVEVMQAFIDVAYYQSCIRLATDKLSDSQELLKKSFFQEKLGMKGRPDVAQIKAQVAEDDYNLTHQTNLYNTALLTLKSSMNYPSSDSLTVDTLLQHFVPFYRIENANEIYSLASTNNPAALSANFNLKKIQYQYNINKGKLLPTIILSAGVTTNYYQNFSSGNTALPFHTQFNNNRGEYVGATLSIPIFNGLSWSDARKARNNIEIAKLDRDEVLRKLRTDIEQAVMDRNGYVKEIIQMEKKVDSDSLAYSVARRKFEEGMMNAIDLHTTSSTLLQSKITLLQKRMLYVMKDKLIDYYKGKELY